MKKTIINRMVKERKHLLMLLVIWQFTAASASTTCASVNDLNAASVTANEAATCMVSQSTGVLEEATTVNVIRRKKPTKPRKGCYGWSQMSSPLEI